MKVKKQMKKKFDIIILAAAASDYIPKNQYTKKIKSTKKSLTLKLKKAPKIIDHIKKLQKDVFLIGFKAEVDISKKELVLQAKQKLKDSKADMIIANDIGKKYFKDTRYNELLIVDSKKVVTIGRNKKERIAKLICKNIEKRI
uniref:Phosphopantothenoylcysteine decarboxylase/phosphopantothenate--cysteine ligase (CoaBC, dfp) n=1 Tax=uncultured marine thaumarchaeote KM3_49_A08 TaxID=1456171 RepID=A0A075H7M9_9ARCH|nr:phosphopantothenoylcysteine decarboxylase/phosphopantothenate--cysteine ligase (coaBC, dfp) [uncultured marine thaumarchaeote KM3_49_A08]